VLVQMGWDWVLVDMWAMVTALVSTRNHCYLGSELDHLDTDSIPVSVLVHKEIGLVLSYSRSLLYNRSAYSTSKDLYSQTPT
jgi:hypothetical protein